MPSLTRPTSFISKVVLATALLGTTGHTALASPVLAPHRAVYDISLKDASDRSGIASMNGRIVYEFRGSECEGYTTNFRFVTRIGIQGEERVTDQRTSTYEAPEGESFRFMTKTYVNDQFDREVSGTATRGDEGTLVALKKPDSEDITLNPAMFPSQHMLDLLTRAEKGESFYEQELFDGSEDGDSTMTTTVIIGPQKSTETQQDLMGELADEPYRSVNITYFAPIGQGEGEGLPEYGIAFQMYANGVTRALTMDYGEFALKGALAELEMYDADPC